MKDAWYSNRGKARCCQLRQIHVAMQNFVGRSNSLKTSWCIIESQAEGESRTPQCPERKWSCLVNDQQNVAARGLLGAATFPSEVSLERHSQYQGALALLRDQLSCDGCKNSWAGQLFQAVQEEMTGPNLPVSWSLLYSAGIDDWKSPRSQGVGILERTGRAGFTTWTNLGRDPKYTHKGTGKPGSEILANHEETINMSCKGSWDC